MQAHRHFWERSLNIHFGSSNLTHTHTHSYTACSLSRTISLWVSGPPCCSSCVTWQYIPLRRKHSTQEVIECVCIYVRKRGKVAVEILHALYSIQYVFTWERVHSCVQHVCVCVCMLSTIKQVAPYRGATRPWSPSSEETLQLPGSLLAFSVFHSFSVMTFVSPHPVHSPYTLFDLPPFTGYGFFFAPLGCLAWLPAQISTHSVPQSSQSFGRTVFLHACSVFPLKFLHLLPPCLLCTTPLNRGLWQLGKGMSQKKNMPHGKLYLFPPNTYLREMSQAYPENWVRVAALLPTSVRLRYSNFLKIWFCFVMPQNTL